MLLVTAGAVLPDFIDDILAFLPEAAAYSLF
jgi:hypothetical protein